MKTIIKLTTGNGVNEMNIHSTGDSHLEFINIESAKTAFEKEIETLDNTYTSENEVGYSMDEVTESDKVVTRVDVITIDEDGYIDNIETVFESKTYIL